MTQEEETRHAIRQGLIDRLTNEQFSWFTSANRAEGFIQFRTHLGHMMAQTISAPSDEPIFRPSDVALLLLNLLAQLERKDVVHDT